MNFTSESIELFVKVIDTGSFSAAARALNRVPSAVSMGIANIEAELGLQLFERTPRKVIPTATALALAPQARIISEQLKQLSKHAYELSLGLESILKIGVVSDVNNQKLLRAIDQLACKYPLLNIEIITAPQDDILHLLYSEQISICLAGSGQNIKIQEHLQLVSLETVVATISAQHDLITHYNHPIYIEDLINIRQIIVASTDLDITDLRPVIGASYWRTNNLQTAIDMVETGLGWGNFPYSLVKPYIEEGRLIQINFKNTYNQLSVPIYLIWLKDKALPKATRELIELIRQSLDQDSCHNA
ncbi:MAG: LysR family transcriptional regulator [Pseudomonadota bacterium]|uniref:LysR family transcriptional regulator n=1 Tax=Acinetobacter bereziniae TaxID=106648 RepID=A0A8I1ARD7_ACIBZ|nr:LysR family transcriptional regulator [Acinetobacter bereziniae]MEC8124287.1 LysR family transcriptional regulator [Pseudomonadota bacterium]QQC83100.1 LysR family transcriptional regulator [Acinetobacter bereziniae]UUN96257.1 LysR family transcriptional regulator [Acinetobacter bereziniae]